MRLGDLELNETPIVVQSLKSALKDFEDDLQKIKETNETTGYVSWDNVEEDKAAIEDMIVHLEVVLEYYGEQKGK